MSCFITRCARFCGDCVRPDFKTPPQINKNHIVPGFRSFLLESIRIDSWKMGKIRAKIQLDSESA